MTKDKELKKAPGRLIGRWKDEAIAFNQGASDQELANIVHDMAKKEGYDYTISPDKVRLKTKKPDSAPASAPKATPASAPKAIPLTVKAAPPKIQTDGALVEDLQAFVRLVGKEGAKDLVNDMIDRLQATGPAQFVKRSQGPRVESHR